MNIESAIVLVIIIIFSAIIHEVMHGVAADKLGDHTARYAGRLTLNPTRSKMTELTNAASSGFMSVVFSVRKR